MPTQVATRQLPAVISTSALLGANNSYAGRVLADRNAGEALAQWQVVLIGASSTWLLADADAAGKWPARGLAVAAVANGSPALILRQGVVRFDAWAWTPNANLYLSTTPGGITATAPSGSGNVQQVIGWAISATTVEFDFVTTYITKV